MQLRMQELALHSALSHARLDLLRFFSLEDLAEIQRDTLEYLKGADPDSLLKMVEVELAHE